MPGGVNSRLPSRGARCGSPAGPVGVLGATAVKMGQGPVTSHPRFDGRRRRHPPAVRGAAAGNGCGRLPRRRSRPPSRSAVIGSRQTRCLRVGGLFWRRPLWPPWRCVRGDVDARALGARAHHVAHVATARTPLPQKKTKKKKHLHTWRAAPRRSVKRHRSSDEMHPNDGTFVQSRVHQRNVNLYAQEKVVAYTIDISRSLSGLDATEPRDISCLDPATNSKHIVS